MRVRMEDFTHARMTWIGDQYDFGEVLLFHFVSVQIGYSPVLSGLPVPYLLSIVHTNKAGCAGRSGFERFF